MQLLDTDEGFRSKFKLITERTKSNLVPVQLLLIKQTFKVAIIKHTIVGQIYIWREAKIYEI